MKKILLSFAVAFVSLAASAQVYVGGSVGIASSKTDGADAVTTISSSQRLVTTLTVTGQSVLHSVGVRVTL